MNSRVSTLLWMLAVAVAAFGLYMVKYRVQAVQAEIAQVTRQLEEEREGLNVSAAEWAYLTQPGRIQRLSEKYLRMQPAKTGQMAGMEALDSLNPGAAGGDEMIVPASARSTIAGNE